MNQILVTKKLYITPEWKRKKKLYRFEFFISIFLICILFSYYIYAEYDKSKSEEVSKDILSAINIETQDKTDNTMMKTEDNVLLIILDDEEDLNQIEQEYKQEEVGQKREVMTSKSGEQYTVEGTINIPKINVNYPVLSHTTEELLKMAPNKFWGGEMNEVGNYCIVAHNYRNSRFFSKVPTLVNGDMIELTDFKGRTINYVVYDKDIVKYDDVSCTSQLTNGKKEITLITCTDNGMQSGERVIVRATEVL